MRVLLGNKKGFTVIELIVVVTVLGILTQLVLGPLGNFYQANMTSLGRTTKETDIRGVLRQVESEIANNNGFMDTYAVVAPLGAKSGSSWGANWSYKGMGGDYSTQRVLIASVPATSSLSSNDPTGSRYPIFTALSGTCPADPTASMAVMTTVVYFMAPAPSSNASQPPSRTNPYNLYRRTIVPALGSGMQYCYGRTPAQKTTCAPGVANSACLAQDALLVFDIRAFDVQYYLNQDAAAPITGQYTTPTNPITDAKAIKITATTGQLANGIDTTIEASIRVSRTY